MIIELTGCTYCTSEKKDGVKVKTTHKPGKPFECNDKDAQALIDAGKAKKSDAKLDAQKDDDKPLTEIEVRQKLEAKALELKIGTEAEIKALGNDELKKKVGEKGGEGIKGFIDNLFKRG